MDGVGGWRGKRLEGVFVRAVRLICAALSCCLRRHEIQQTTPAARLRVPFPIRETTKPRKSRDARPTVSKTYDHARSAAAAAAAAAGVSLIQDHTNTNTLGFITY